MNSTPYQPRTPVGDAVNLEFLRNVVGKSRIADGAVVCRTPNGYPLGNGFRAMPVTELD